ncbi:hypothetical protein [Sphingomonas sp.]|uniref:hypothetical protein n=1 Tax=Sphingomonas sp. TaxID=28214 RepID=UPI00286B99E9|nr:hypothetical protein [Sphingomonas sp.]
MTDSHHGVTIVASPMLAASIAKKTRNRVGATRLPIVVDRVLRRSVLLEAIGRRITQAGRASSACAMRK